MTFKKFAILSSCLLLCSFTLHAQFHSSGTDRASVKWRQIETSSFRIIFPEGCDSLAREYARTIERYSDDVGRSVGFSPNGSYRRKMPVILHCETAYSNGEVTWAPRRIDLLTIPDAYEAVPFPGMDQLLIHETRHSCQMQAGHSKMYSAFNYLTGQLFPGAMSAIYPGPSFLEGDAVVAETALTSSGRGRSADFLEYYRMSFDNGDWRNYWKWRFGSQKYYTPDHYALGYLDIAGIRFLSDDGNFVRHYFDRIGTRFFPFSNWDKTVKETTGMKGRDAFEESQRLFQRLWKENEEERVGFMPSEAVVRKERKHTEYKNLISVADHIYAIRSGLNRTNELVSVDSSGEITRISAFQSSASRLSLDIYSGELFWSETVPDRRWEMVSFSEIRAIAENGHKRIIAGKSRFYNPSFIPDEGLICCIEYLPDGEERIVFFDRDGDIVNSIKVPGGIQVVESVMAGSRLVVSAIVSTPGNEGFALFEAGNFSKPLLGPVPVRISHLGYNGGRLTFTSDRNGVTELYSLSDGQVRQLSSTRYGAKDFVFKGDSLYYTMLSPEGRLIYRTAVDDLPDKLVDFEDIHKDPIAEKLSLQEAELKKDENMAEGETQAATDSRRYSKLSNLFRLHSWAPICVDIDNIANLSFDALSSSVGLGVTAFFQNDLGTSSGYLSYNIPSTVNLSYSYSGLYPVFELKGSIGKGFASGSLKTYVPLCFNSSGVLRGVVPSFTTSLSSSLTNEGKTVLSNRQTLTLRAYSMLPIASSCIYPRLGIGAEVGYSWRFGSPDITPALYTYFYGYLPGIIREHGLKLTATAQFHTRKTKFAEPFAKITPRGITSRDALMKASAFPYQLKITADYAIPFAPVDWSFLCPVAYIRNFELIPHADWMGCLSSSGKSFLSMSSIGADFDVRLSNFLWIPYDTRIGVSWSYNNGVPETERHHIGLIFSVDF